MQHILIVEDEVKLATLLKDYLERNCFKSTMLNHGDEVMPWLEQNKPDLVLLDLMLPGIGGMDICKEIRRNSSLPIIMVTAKVEEIDRLLGLELGADDYICKPFSPREVVARVKAVLRRSESPERLEEKGLKLDTDTYKATINGNDLDLTAVEFQLLKVLSDQPGRIFHVQCWLTKFIAMAELSVIVQSTATSRNCVKKIAVQLPDVELIHSLYAVGYKFEWS